ncbi:MAG: hypothetical protein A3C80_04425 [Candidatus Ryanbacteria bacterium RIFCSPHIGHO2_02_FULL_45_43]|uniref:Type II secretion system protein GspG C-terminal domain-containing protein n=1 Tax=Candidatus Ryanbacteria bacterium RIFCSPHIGHO2_01_45_13 TaxID=1802112 RepID=A0A1G2G007_9BACT|nr:MAG: hypothetical protein A2718_04325 [Candidatus Ryanbacteria bacterium RIFCSPHIGHO2_01_FULL_44_130]OGZ43639.1 MAG: hypothetical protein A2W41_04820 [Candidatus Ryanbacteria bacterium RIFCSPHIGHO2_01_45_13]OGZ49121.1 MAG: hypothetical protein A3C80_04425 [Candidatus Ryanbacteria bacterium RIFCSPHIGHO2_02_FULL_45_43]OGZ50904.1 MAG: hypothetical protein A3E55_00500 [Candidatus Ryanbacteria bacterium RIFCSPHIGHO2_12_FULL_44_20]OGZ51381.1 MAG: hypothetical protein A3A17_00125 [Candidatus Ryanba
MVKKTTNSGFTLIELLTVIVIIGLIATAVVVALSARRKDSRDARRIADIAEMKIAFELFFDSEGATYPRGDQTDVNYQSLAPAHIAALPKDPLDNADYFYRGLHGDGSACGAASASCASYVVGAKLETGHKALDGDNDGTYGSLDCSDPVYCYRP